MSTKHRAVAEGKYATTFLPFAAYLHCTGRLKFAGCEPVGDGQHVRFVFDDSEGQGEGLSIEFESGAECSAAGFYDSIRRLRRLTDQALARRGGGR